MAFIRLVLHRLRVYRWLLSCKKTALDLLGEAFISISSRWHGELYPVLTYIPMFDYLRQSRFSGEFLELGGGYSTVIAINMFDTDKVRVKSVDLNPAKYNRILNSISSKKNFLSLIENIEQPTVSLNEVFVGLESLQAKLKTFPREAVAKALAIYVRSGDAECEKIVNAIFSESVEDLKSLIVAHPNYAGDLKFYQDSNYEQGSGYCATLASQGNKADAVFFDCGEISSLGEWHLLEDAIKVGGYALFHDVYYPKSIKNFLIVTYVELSDRWKVVYRESVSPQGGLVAIKFS